MSHENIAILWKVLCSFLVFLMQVGFMCIESGSVRRKNNSSVAFKNLIDFFICFTLFTFIGFGIYFGESVSGFFSIPTLSEVSNLSAIELANFLYLSGFASATCTIVSGAIAERSNSKSYLMITILLSLLCFPFVAHWVWSPAGFLNKLGFIDLAGSAVVHSVGGVASVALLLVIGARNGVDLKSGKRPSPSNHVEIVLGAFFLIICWIGFNAGSTDLPNYDSLKIIINTLVSASFGFITALVLQFFFRIS
jgi:Amt family ammonium transporter